MTAILEATADSAWWIRAPAVTALALHVGGGLVAIPAGYAALALRKGGRPHRIAGDVFVVSMLFLGVFAVPLGLPIGGLFTCYLVATAWQTVRRPAGTVGRLEAAGFVFAVALALAALAAGPLAAAGVPVEGDAGAGLYVVAAATALCARLDLQMIRRGGATGFERVRRHLWRMCTAMFVATGSFFLGQADTIPRALQGPHLWVLALAPLGALIFWTAKSRLRRRPGPVLAAT